MNHIKLAVQAGAMTAGQANKMIRARYGHKDFREYPVQHLTFAGVCTIDKCWANQDFTVVLYRHKELGYHRLTINRNQITKSGDYKASITWDELQQIKSDVGYGDRFAVEVYPPDDELINVANMRHLVLLDSPPIYRWDEADYRKKSRENGFIPEDEMDQ